MKTQIHSQTNLPPGQHLALIKERVILYLRLLGLEENTVSGLTETVLQRLIGKLKPGEQKKWPALALEETVAVLKAQKINPDPRYHELFTEAYRPAPNRTPMGYHEFDPKKTFWQSEQYASLLRTRRIFFFSLVIFSTIAGSMTITKILSPHGLGPLKWTIIAIFTFLFGWIAINFWTIIFGFFISLREHKAMIDVPASPRPIAPETRIALIMPVHNEEVPRIFAALRAMYDTIRDAGVLKHFDIYVLSDSTSKAHGIAEEIYWARLCQEVNGFGKIFYRRRKLRLHKKSGNVSDFCRRWGWQYKYMITLDADSLIDGNILIRMVNTMERHPDIGILQTPPMAMNQTSLIARLQQFASHVYGPLFFAGLRFWQLDESGFWGHNAIIRMEPFIKYCALPRLSGRPPFGGEILSHDFVEAALMRRAGWGVWLAHELEHSYEELPPNLLEELSRDKRWCQGNLQHLRLLFMAGIKLGHRILFLQGNLFYFSSLMWLSLLMLMTANGIVTFFQKTVYFTAERSLFPSWTVEYRTWSGLLFTATAVFLFTPKILSLILISLDDKKSEQFGGPWRLGISIILETVFSTLLAPLRMIFHSWYIFLNLTNQKLMWNSQMRLSRKTSLREACRAHWPATLLALLWAGIAYGVNQTLFWWISVIVTPLIFSIPISIFYSYSSVGIFFRDIGLFLVPTETRPSKVLQRYQQLLDAQAGKLRQ
ncbi:MAG TPA: glucans biosynthesis glucosyltransferase MdoH [Candidatus Omnitrophota bacterium]|nr:glucans biosynthesis glucosyltransferase MdoH [Candidatus Omnitrophota bacterium]HSA31664.1 glucans biosynthesis glucosyltransferase MdoH [Candidatus Omnitrophota bacterium]